MGRLGHFVLCSPPKPANGEEPMATDAILAPTSGEHPTYKPENRTRERVFYSGMAIFLCILLFSDFSPTYFQAGMMRAPLPSPILHIHGAVFTLWMLLF